MQQITICTNKLSPMMTAKLTKFVSVMVKKLEKNVHKDPVREKDIPILLNRHMGELGEFIEAWLGYGDDDTSEELADMANFAFLIFMALEEDKDAGF